MQTPMATNLLRLAVLATGLLFSLMASAESAPIDPAAGCEANPARVAQCFEVKGRISIYNGTPAMRIAPTGSKRLLGVVPAEEEIMPDVLKQSVSLEQDAYASMRVCPFTSAKARRMQLVCIESASDIRSLPRR